MNLRVEASADASANADDCRSPAAIGYCYEYWIVDCGYWWKYWSFYNDIVGNSIVGYWRNGVNP
ncbi:MAG: hypothetical protein ACOYES_02795, partial [Bacillota bacterium]